MAHNQKRPRRRSTQSAWSQIDYGQALETRLNLTPSTWETMTRHEAMNRLLALRALALWQKSPVEFFSTEN